MQRELCHVAGGRIVVRVSPAKRSGAARSIYLDLLRLDDVSGQVRVVRYRRGHVVRSGEYFSGVEERGDIAERIIRKGLVGVLLRACFIGCAVVEIRVGLGQGLITLSFLKAKQ